MTDLYRKTPDDVLAKITSDIEIRFAQALFVIRNDPKTINLLARGGYKSQLGTEDAPHPTRSGRTISVLDLRRLMQEPSSTIYRVHQIGESNLADIDQAIGEVISTLS